MLFHKFAEVVFTVTKIRTLRIPATFGIKTVRHYGQGLDYQECQSKTRNVYGYLTFPKPAAVAS